MTISIVGSGASEGVPSFLCNCTGCRRARRTPQIKMAWDMGRFDHGSLLGVLVTHRHEDHTLGLKYLRDADPKNGVHDAHPIQLWLPAEVEESWFPRSTSGTMPGAGASHASAIEVRVVDGPREFSLGPFMVSAVETYHLRTAGIGDARGHSFGYLIEDADGKRLAYMVDSPASFPERTFALLSAHQLDCLVFECTFAHSQSPDQHTDLEGLRTVHRSLRPRVMIATHISHQNMGHRALLRLLAPQGIRAGFDGMRVRF